MKLHRNARLSVKGRELLVERVLRAGWSLAAAAEAAQVKCILDACNRGTVAGRRNRALGRGAVCELVVRAAAVAGVGHVNAHRLRHTLASEMLAGGADLPAIGQVLGHRMLEATAIYAKCVRETLRQIARPWPGASA